MDHGVILSLIRPGGSIDWNCNGALDPNPVRVDVNGDGETTKLSSFNDWEHLVYEGGSLGAGGAARVLPRRTPGGDAPVAVLIKSARIVRGDLKAPTLSAGKPVRQRDGSLQIPITVRDNKELALLVFMIDRTSYQLAAKKGQKLMRARGIVRKPGRRLIRIAATDRVGNRSRLIQLRVVIRK